MTLDNNEEVKEVIKTREEKITSSNDDDLNISIGRK